VVSARQSSDRLTIVVEDDGVGAEPQPTRRSGIGLSSLKARLAYGFGQAATLELAGGTDGKGTRVTLHLPMQQEQR
jgi:LytS/YehU family sensor histidine kinase